MPTHLRTMDRLGLLLLVLCLSVLQSDTYA